MPVAVNGGMIPPLTAAAERSIRVHEHVSFSLAVTAGLTFFCFTFVVFRGQARKPLVCFSMNH